MSPVRVGLFEVALTVSTCDSPPPAEMPDKGTNCCAASSLIVTLVMVSIVVESFRGFAVTINVLVMVSMPAAVPPLSCTVIVIVALPDWLAVGVNDKEPVLFGL